MSKLRDRIPKAIATKQQDLEMQQVFIQGADKNLYDHLQLKTRSLDDLARQYHMFDNQTQLIKGMILLEGRERLKDNKKFGDWVKDNDLDSGSMQARNNYINLARFFRSRSMDGIVLSAAYELSRPKYEKVAQDVYSYIKDKNMRHQDVVKLLESKYAETEEGQVKQEELKIAAELDPVITNFEVAPVTQNVTINGSFKSIETVNIATNTNTLTKVMPLEILRLSKEFKERERKTEFREETFTTKSGETHVDIVEVEVDEDDPVKQLKFTLTEQEKVEQVKELINIIAKGKMEAFIIAKAASDFFLASRYG